MLPGAQKALTDISFLVLCEKEVAAKAKRKLSSPNEFNPELCGLDEDFLICSEKWIWNKDAECLFTEKVKSMAPIRR